MPPITIRQWGNHSQRDRNWATISAIAGLIPVSCVTIWHPLQTMPIWFIQFGHIQFRIWTNTFGNLDKYKLQLGEIQVASDVTSLKLVGTTSAETWSQAFRPHFIVLHTSLSPSFKKKSRAKYHLLLRIRYLLPPRIWESIISASQEHLPQEKRVR